MIPSGSWDYDHCAAAPFVIRPVYVRIKMSPKLPSPSESALDKWIRSADRDCICTETGKNIVGSQQQIPTRRNGANGEDEHASAACMFAQL